MRKANLFVLSIFFKMTGLALANDTVEYEVIQAKAVYIGGDFEGKTHVFDTAEEAMRFRVSLRCTSEYSNCDMQASGPPEFSGNYSLWRLPITYSAYWIPVSKTVSYNEVMMVFYQCPAYGGWVNRFDLNSKSDQCWRPLPPKSECDPCNVKANEPVPSAGNPIVLFDRVKRQTEQDYTNAAGTLKIVRDYQSNTGKWVHNYERYAIDYGRVSSHGLSLGECFLDIFSKPTPHCYPYVEVFNTNRLVLRRGNGRRVRFDTAGNSVSSENNDRANPLLDSQGGVAGWRISNTADLSVEEYSLDGRLRSITAQDGKVAKLEYSTSVTPKEIAPQPGLLIRVTDAFGAALSFRYNALGQMASITDPEAGNFIYRYDDSGNLNSVTYPDGKSKTYLYNESQYLESSYGSRYLTGIIDENNARYATFTYVHDEAFSTEHTGGVDRYEVSTPYVSERIVKEPLGTSRRYIYEQVGPSKTWRSSGVRKWSNTGSGGVVSSSISYDDQSNVSSKKDFDGTLTQFTYDLTRNLETKRVEAVNDQLVRTITTEWHPTFRLPAKIIEPLKVTKFKYDTTGNLLEKSVQATLDKTGAQGAAAAVTGKIRTWKYTYNTVGQMLTSTDPDTATTTFTYDQKGNLETVENALKQVTKYSNYDANGRVGRIEDPNGLVQEFSYTPRGWLETRTVKGRQWRYTYDGVGQLKRVDSPDGTFVSYTYDDAHRLVKVTDSLGNSINYTLDAMGNRKAEEVKDPSNTLVRKVSRTYDTLNQLKQQTGGTL